MHQLACTEEEHPVKYSQRLRDYACAAATTGVWRAEGGSGCSNERVDAFPGAHPV